MLVEAESGGVYVTLGILLSHLESTTFPHHYACSSHFLPSINEPLHPPLSLQIAKNLPTPSLLNDRKLQIFATKTEFMNWMNLIQVFGEEHKPS